MKSNYTKELLKKELAIKSKVDPLRGIIKINIDDSKFDMDDDSDLLLEKIYKSIREQNSKLNCNITY